LLVSVRTLRSRTRQTDRVTSWLKAKNADYSQMFDRRELFELAGRRHIPKLKLPPRSSVLARAIIHAALTFAISHQRCNIHDPARNTRALSRSARDATEPERSRKA
jgi:hypothetical protein